MPKIVNLNVPMKAMYWLMGTSAALILAGFYSLNAAGSKQGGLSQVKAGNSICFHRMTQTFTALMIRDKSSAYLTDEFKDTTSKCLDDLKTAVLGVEAPKVVAKSLNNLQSDYHWFVKKIDRLQSLSGEVDIFQSNITGKYGDLESLKDSIDSEVASEAQRLARQEQLATVLLGLSLLVFAFASLVAVLRNRIGGAQLAELNDQAETVKEFDIIAPKLFSVLNKPNLESSIMEHVAYLRAENARLEDSLIRMNTMGEEVVYDIDLPEDAPRREITAFNGSFNNVLNSLQDKAFENGILIDTDLNEEFSIFSAQEPLEQLLLSLVSFAMDNTKTVKVRSKALGGIAYCKVRIENFAFHEADIEFINGREATANTNVNLVLLRELLADTDAKIAVRNKKNSKENKNHAEIEVIFERVHPSHISKVEEVELVESARKEVTVVKGTKSQIRDFFDTQA